MTEIQPRGARSGGAAAPPAGGFPGCARTDEFLAILAHELRNPLSAIHNAVQLMGTSHVTPERLAWVRELLERQLGQLTRLIDDLLDASRVSSGRIRLQCRPLDLADAIREALDGAHTLIDERRHSLTVELPGEPVIINGDRVRITQALTNLLLNAAMYTPEGGVITVVLEAAGRHGTPWAVARVRDSGAGIHPDQLEHVFGLFTQVHPPAAAAPTGLGIGLALVRGLVELHGGSVSARSDGPGLGSEFVMRLPQARDVRAAQARPARAPAAAPQPLRVLIVDDNVDTATALALYLHEEGGHTTRLAHSGDDGLAAAHEFEPQLVLLDIGLPDIDGCEVARRLRRDPQLGDVPLIALTGYGGESSRRRALDAGFNDYLVKPVPYDVLNGVLAKRAPDGA